VVQELRFPALAVQFSVYVIISFALAAAIDSGLLDSKDFFIAGLPFSAVVAATVAVLLLRRRSPSLVRLSTSATIASLWFALLALYFVLELLTERTELLRFVRMQVLMLPIMATVGMVIAVASSPNAQRID
jgi:peptidoglycan/LPS O-acetylase OafA/YrhL